MATVIVTPCRIFTSNLFFSLFRRFGYLYILFLFYIFYYIYIYIYMYILVYQPNSLFFFRYINLYIYLVSVCFLFYVQCKCFIQKKIGLYSDDMCYDIVAVNESLDFFWNVFNSKAIKACHTFIVHKDSYLVFLLIYTHQYSLCRSHPSPCLADCFVNIHL